MATRTLLDRQGSYRTLVVNRDVVKEIAVGVWEILSDERTTTFFAGQSTLYRGGDHADGGLGPQHLEKIGVGDEGVLVKVEGFGRDADVFQLGKKAVHAVCSV